MKRTVNAKQNFVKLTVMFREEKRMCSELSWLLILIKQPKNCAVSQKVQQIKLKCKLETIKQFPRSACNIAVHEDEYKISATFNFLGNICIMWVLRGQERKSCSNLLEAFEQSVFRGTLIISAPRQPACPRSSLQRVMEQRAWATLYVWPIISKGACVARRTLSS